MKQPTLTFLLLTLLACSPGPQKEEQSVYSLEEQPAKTIIDFLKWYGNNSAKIDTALVNNAAYEAPDSTKPYSVNFKATERYLAALKSSGFVSDKYVAKWREYFKECDENFKANPAWEGPPDGFDYDFVMQSQDYDDILKNPEKAKVAAQSVSDNQATVTLHFDYGNKLTYKLSNEGGKWKIDDIEPLQ